MRSPFSSTYAFQGWPFRKIDMEVAGYNFNQFRAATRRYVVEEGRLKEHVSLDGVYWDLLLLALWRQSWDREGSHLRRHA